MHEKPCQSHNYKRLRRQSRGERRARAVRDNAVMAGASVPPMCDHGVFSARAIGKSFRRKAWLKTVTFAD